MSSPHSLIDKALKKIRATSEVNPATEDQVAEGFDELRAMMAEWRDKGIDVGVMDFESASTEIGEPRGATYPIMVCLAVRLGDALGVVVSGSVRNAADTGYNHVYRYFRTVTPLNRPLSEQLPRGSGRYQRYFDEGDRVGNDQGLSNIDTL